MVYQLRRSAFSLLVIGLIALTLTACLGGGSYVISGLVTDAEGHGLAGVRLVLDGGTTGHVVTNAAGKWEAKVKGIVTVTPESQEGYLFSPPLRSNITKQSGSNLTFQRVSNKIFWYMSRDFENFSGAITVIAPPNNITDSKYAIVAEENNPVTEAPTGYDVLVLSDVGATFDVSKFTGRIIVTLDSSVSPLMCWMTGDYQEETYWDFDTKTELKWVKPITGSERGASSDARICNLLDGVEGFTRRHDLIQASSTEDCDDVVLYEITKSGRSWWWLHIGPHFGGYEDRDFTTQRVWEIINYTLDLINGYNPVCPALPEMSPSALSLSPVERN